MLYLGTQPVYSIGDKALQTASFKDTRHSNSLYVANACLVARYASQTGNTRNVWMDRVYDWINYSNIPFGDTPPAGGFEVEAVIEPVEASAYYTLWGTRTGTIGKITRANILINGSGQISQGLSVLPSTNPAYDGNLFGRKIHVRLICLPTTSEDYTHAYSGRIIVEDAITGETLTDETEIFGDVNGTASNAMFSNWSTFYRFHSAWFSRNRYANPIQNTPSANDFKGYFFGGAVYINPTGADGSIPTRVPVQILTPVKAGQTYEYKFGAGAYTGSTTIQETGVFVEIVDIEILMSTGEIQNRFARMMTKCQEFTDAVLKYID